MSIYGSCNFKLFMGDAQPIQQSKTIELEETPKKTIKPPNTFFPNILLIFKDLFKYNLPIITNKEGLHKYILEISKIEEKMNLNEKYICSICLSINKNLFTKEIIESVLEEEFHLILMKWLKNEKHIIEEPNRDNPYKFNIYIGLLINIISLFEIFPIKTRDLCKFHLYKKLLKLSKLIKLNINNSFPFLLPLNKLLNKWKQQIDCFSLSPEAQNFTFLGKKTKANSDEQYDNKNKNNKNNNNNNRNNNNNNNNDNNININNNNININNKMVKIDFKDKNETEASSEEKEEANIQTKKNKKFFSELERNKVFFYDKNNSNSKFINQNEINDPEI